MKLVNPKPIKGYISAKESDLYLKEFKTEVSDIKITFPKELGIKHPFEMEDIEKICKKFGVINGIINKFTDSIVGEFSIQCDNENARQIIKDFMKDTNLSVNIRSWIWEGLSKGNGYMELDLIDNELRVLNAKDIYVLRDKKGNILGYNQYIGPSDFRNWQKKIIPLKASQIAHLKINEIAGEAYGLGMIYPNERTIENLILLEQDLIKLTKRKAGAPIHVKIGQPGEVANTAVIDSFKQSLQYLTNRTEWVTDGNVEMNTLQFNELGKNIQDQLNYLTKELCAGMEVPEVLLNSGQLNEGIAKTQDAGWKRKIAAIQEKIESIIENQIFKVILQNNGLNAEVKFIWNLPGEEEINARLEKLNMLLGNFSISENMKRMLQLEVAKLLDIEDYDEYLLNPESGVDEANKQMNDQQKQAQIGQTEAKTEIAPNKEREKEENLKQPEVPGVKKSADIPIIEKKELTLIEYANLQETAGFNYSDYIRNILKVLKSYEFNDLKAINEQDIELGMLPEVEIEKLRIILKDGFKKNLSINQIEVDIKDYMKIPDRYIMENDKKILSQSAEVRPIAIARTETLILANQGLIKTYEENDIKEVSWLAVFSDRTCPICEGLNGQIMTNQEYLIKRNNIHPMCRCTALPIQG